MSRAGRIPGAINLPFSKLYDDAGHRVKPVSTLAFLISPQLRSGDAKIITYCNTGHWSSIDWFVLHELLGYTNTRLYDGSVAVWTNDPNRPVETGEPRGHKWPLGGNRILGPHLDDGTLPRATTSRPRHEHADWSARIVDLGIVRLNQAARFR